MEITLKDIEAAQKRIAPYLKRTPLIRCTELEKALHHTGRIFLKKENDLPTGSFKDRAAYNSILRLSDEQKERGVVARSVGNFAVAVSCAAGTLGVKATIVVPETASKVKIQGTLKCGAKVILAGQTADEGDKVVEQLVKEEGLYPLHPYNDPWTIEGGGTVGLEVIQDCPDIGNFVCPIGGGGLMSGCAIAIKSINPSTWTIGPEPSQAGDYYDSRQLNKHVRWTNIETIADGLSAESVGELNYPILNRLVDEVGLVSEEEIKKAMKWLYENLGLIIEGGGAVGVAYVLSKGLKNNKDTVILLTGQNVEQESFHKWINEIC